MSRVWWRVKQKSIGSVSPHAWQLPVLLNLWLTVIATALAIAVHKRTENGTSLVPFTAATLVLLLCPLSLVWLKLAARYWKPSKATSKQSRPPPLDGCSRGPSKQKSRTAVLVTVLCSSEKHSSPRCKVVKTMVCVLVILGVLFLLLLLAGDVERNPGPTIVTVERVAEVAALLDEMAAFWNLFLGQLGVPQGKLDQIQLQSVGQPNVAQYCLTRGLHHWVVSDESPTYEKIIAVFNGNFLPNRPLARKVEEFAQSVETIPHASTTDDVIAGYADQMRGYYRAAIPQCFSLTWPPPPTHKILNLSMISHDQYNYGSSNDEILRPLYLGNVDQVMTENSTLNVEIKNLFKLDKAKRKVVLIEGAPGAGKSTLAWHICQKWKAGKLFQEFKLVVFVQLRDPAIRSAKNLADLFPHLKSVAREVVSRMEIKGGEGLLFVLDGWDEFPPGLRGNELIQNLICNPAAIAMHFSTLLITSRPVASGDLHQYALSRVETIGFRQTELKLYFKEALNGADKIEALQICLRNRPVIEASCYLPLNASIIVHLFRVYNTLPNTLHGVFLNLVMNCIVRHVMREGHEPPRISSLDDLPPDMQTQLNHICAMAYHGVMENRVTFSEDDLKSFHLPTNISTLSLIQGVESLMATYKLRSYNFLHLSVQELLTSYHISKLPTAEQVKIFKELFGQPRFAAVFQYYAAFTKLQTAGIQDIIVSIIRRRDKTLLLTLLHCLYEAQDSSLCQFVASELKGELDLSYNSLSPVYCIAVGYFLHQCATICPITAILKKCSLDSYKLELLGKELKQPIQAVTFQVCIRLSSSSFDGNLTRLIATELIASASVISKLCLADNPIQDGEDGLSHLCQTLTTNTSLVELYLHHCNLTITEENAQALSHMLRTNKTLKVFVLSNNSINGRGVRYLSEDISSSAISKLYLADNPIQDGEDGLSHLCQALTDTSIVELYLHHCNLTITEENAQALSHMLRTNKTLKVFVLSNNSINGCGVRYLSEGISSSSAISKLDLSHNSIQDGEDGLSHLCKALTDTSIVELNLSVCKLTITKENGQVLSHMLKTNKTLNVFVLSHNSISGRGVRYLSEGISSSAISKLNLSGNRQDGEDGLSHLCQALTTNISLVDLNLSFSLHEASGPALRHMLETNKTLMSLDLSYNNYIMSKHNVAVIAEGLRSNHSLKCLNLRRCDICDAGMKSLADCLMVNDSLEELVLSENTISPKAARGFSDLLKRNSTLKKLEMTQCGVTDEAVKSLASALEKNSSLEELCICHNHNLTDTALVALGESLKRNTGLKTLVLMSPGTPNGWRQFVQCLKDNHSLELLRTDQRELDVVDVNIVRKENNLPELQCPARIL